MSTSNVLTGFLAGAALGAVAGILFAPDKGSNTRQKISSKACEVTDSVKGSVNDLIGSAKDAYSSLKGEAEDLGDTAKAKMNNVKNEVKNTYA